MNPFDWIPEKAWEYGGFYVLIIIGIVLATLAARAVWKWMTQVFWGNFLEPIKERLIAHCDDVEQKIGELVGSSHAMSESIDSLSFTIKNAPQCRYPMQPPNQPPG